MSNNGCLKILFSLVFIFLFALGFLVYKINCNTQADKLYNQGTQLYNAGKYQDAYYNFSQISKSSFIYPLALLKQFQCADVLQDKKTALVKLDLLAKRVNNDNIRPYILYNELIYNLDTKKYSSEQLVSKFSYIQKTYPDSDFAKASSYQIAKLEKTKNPVLAKEKFVEYLEYAPVGKFCLDALSEVVKLRVYLTNEEGEIIADAYIANSKYREALNVLRSSSFEKNWIKFAKIYRALGDYTLEQETISRGLAFKNETIDEKEVSQMIDRLVVLSKTDKRQYLTYLYEKYSNNACCATIAYKLASISKYPNSIRLYDTIVTNHPSSYWASNSLWEVFWFNYSNQKYSTAIQLANKYIEQYPDTEDLPRISYWRAKSLHKLKKNSQAKESYYEIINSYPLSYYSFLSARQLRMSKADKIFLKKEIHKYSIDNINKELFNDDKYIMALLKYEDYETIEDLKINNEFIKSWLLYKKKQFPQSIKTAKDACNKDIKFSAYQLKLIYPIIYEDLINEFSKANNISPYLFMSLIREESHFNKEARSSVGALGLSQLMPATANYIEKRTVSKSELINETANVEIGAKYYAYLLDYFKGSNYLAILAYNAGHGNVSKWLSNPNIYRSEIDEFIELVPFQETKTYIKKILSSYWVYLNIYNKI